MAACARPGYRGTISMYQTAGSLWTLTGDESVTSRVTFLTAWASIKRGHQSSLSPCFQSACHAFKHTVSPAFTFTLTDGFPNHLSRALATFVSLSKATVQSNYPPAAVPSRVSCKATYKWCYIVAPRAPKHAHRRSHLRYVYVALQQLQDVVKLHGDFISH